MKKLISAIESEIHKINQNLLDLKKKFSILGNAHNLFLAKLDVKIHTALRSLQ